MQELQTSGIGYLAGAWPLDTQKPTIVFIHGAGGSSIFWQNQIIGLCDRFNTIALDLPGRGRSPGAGKQAVADYAEIVVKFIAQTDIADPILCGLSMGGAIVQQVLLDQPELPKGGVLIGTGARMAVAPAFFETIDKDYNGFVDWMCKICVSKKTDPPKIRPFREDLLRCRPEVVSGDFRACDRFDVSEQVHSIEVPVMVITAEEDKLTPPKFGEFLHKRIRTASRVHIADAGHLVPMEKPGETNQAILRFHDEFPR